MKHTFKKVAAILLAALMCVSASVPAFATDVAKCPGTNSIHDATNCTYVQVSEDKATCESKGIVTGRCTTCATVFKASEIPALGHDWNDVVPATCDAPATRTCKTCKAEITVSPKLTHLYTAYTVSGGVCKVGERISRECIYCGLEDKKIIGASGHEFALASYSEPSNCVTDGQAKYTCIVSGCGASKVVPIKANATNATNPHNYVSWASVKGEAKDPNAVAKTCTVSGKESVICSLCGDVKVKSLGKANHTLSAIQAVKPATCVTPGFEAYYYCVDCPTYFNSAAVQKQYAELVIPAHHNNPEKLDITIEVSPSCTNAGWRYISCKVCDTYKDQKVDLARYTSHLYYANVTKKEDKVNILKALGLYRTDADVDTVWKNLGNVEIGASGQGRVWKDYIPATCTTNASVTWICLNCTFNQKNNAYVRSACEVGQVAKPVGEGYDAFGHNFTDIYPSTNKNPGTAYTDNPPATCTSQGIRVQDCVNEYIDYMGNTQSCNATNNKPMAPLGHKEVKKDSITVGTVTTVSKAATCRENGLQCYACERECGYTRTEVIYSNGTQHVWVYLNDGAAKIAELDNKCNATVTVQRHCGIADCPASKEPVSYIAVGPDHVYYDITDAVKLDALKNLNTATNPSIKASADENAKVVVLKTRDGNCESGAAYKLSCYKCDMFKTYEITEGFAKGHKKTYIGNTSLAATCWASGGSNQWYCSNEGCANYADDTNGTPALGTFTPGRDTVYVSNHYLWNATTKTAVSVTYKNVPDTRISGAASLTAAKAVEAPVDSNGIVIKSVAIEGTSLVWLYKYTAKDHTETTIANGGLYCVDCKAYYGEGYTTIPVSGGHSYAQKASVPATCQNYGYTLWECVCGDSYQTGYQKISTHTYLFLNPTDRLATAAAWNNLQVAQKEGRSYIAPRCAVAGYAIDVCTVCKVTSTVTFAATGHMNKYGQTLTSSCLDGPIDRVCSNAGCGFEIKKSHDFANGVCKVCGLPS